ncbi:hypothetical protein NE865_05049 [Phthorimaea operculella]|nr:hypothetical protein NE865_05049 [Phthorimaea operculella]
MGISKQLLLVFTFAFLLSACEAGLVEMLLEWLFGFTTGKRSMQEAITSYLDKIFPKDDVDSDLLKHLFMVYSEDDDVNFSSNFVGLQENV